MINVIHTNKEIHEIAAYRFVVLFHVEGTLKDTSAPALVNPYLIKTLVLEQKASATTQRT